VSKARRKTTSRRALEQQPHFDEISPEVGELDEDALSRALDEDPDDTLALLAELTGATDPELRELARRLAGRLFSISPSADRRRLGASGSCARSATGPTVATSTSMPASTHS
jgi:hypothetical protein